jgi:hypothetical protein
VCVVDAIGDLCGDAVKAAIQKYQKFQDRDSVFAVFYTLMDWAKVHKTSGCFVDAYLSVGFTAGLKIYS